MQPCAKDEWMTQLPKLHAVNAMDTSYHADPVDSNLDVVTDYVSGCQCTCTHVLPLFFRTPSPSDTGHAYCADSRSGL